MSPTKKKITVISIIWKFLLITGSLCGIAVSAFTIWNEINKPSPPRLKVFFVLSGSSSVSFAPTALSLDKLRSNTELPLGLLITNSGGTATDDSVLKLIHPSNLKLYSKTIQLDQQEIYMGPLVKIMTTIRLPSIHSGETIHLEKVLYTDNYKSSKKTDRAYRDVNSDRFDPKDVELLLFPIPDTTPPQIFSVDPTTPRPKLRPVTYEIEVRTSAKNLPEDRSFLYITVGPIEELKNSEDPVFVINSVGDLYRYKKN